MKRHQVMDLFYDDKNEIAEGPWTEVKDRDDSSLPNHKSCKVKVRTKDFGEMFAYFYYDKCLYSMFVKMPGAEYFWCCEQKAPIPGVTHWIALKGEE